jgi:hypothetical protein
MLSKINASIIVVVLDAVEVCVREGVCSWSAKLYKGCKSTLIFKIWKQGLVLICAGNTNIILFILFD